MALNRDRSRRNPRAGLTLLEIMVVMAIVVMVAGLAAPRLMDSFGRAKSQAAQVSMANLKSALQLYYLDTGRYPTEAEGLDALIAMPSGLADWRGPYLEGPDGLTDPWGRRFLYRYPAPDGGFELLTLGRDGQPGGGREDSDITL
ncbi:type II secretion system major pseudopilin GspG (plasmid) [Limimaricola variabilis]